MKPTPNSAPDPQKLNICPWCLTRVKAGDIGGMEPAMYNSHWWHQGCVADVTRAQEGR
jgi:hypothetical protein